MMNISNVNKLIIRYINENLNTLKIKNDKKLIIENENYKYFFILK